VAVGLRDKSSKWRIIEVFGLPEGVKEDVFEDAHVPTANETLNAGMPIAVSDPSDPRIDQGLAGALGVQSMLLAPLSFPGHQFGVVAYAYLSGPGVFNDAQVDFAKKAAASLSLSLENARLYETEHNIADRLQEALLTLPSEVPGIEFAHSYHSATEAARVGGDFYDIFELEHGRVGITIGDVAGKGLDAAVLTSLAKNAIRVHASQKGITPEVVLARANEVVYRSTPMESFVTVFFGILDARDGRLQYSNAGHTTAAIISREGTSKGVPATGPILGAFTGAVFGQGEVFVELGELLFLYTDGLTEARRDGVLLGEERVFDLLRKVKDAQPREAVHRVIDDVLAYTGGQLSDDLAMVALRRL
jgi:serine phosphatase RsbU (regulator of sigma subunit)